jgi:hypothetical protein
MGAKIVDGKVVLDEKEKAEKPVAEAAKKKRYRIMINPQDGPDGKYDVTLGVNGRVIQIKRGEEVVIDEDYFKVLQDAKIDQLVRNPGEEEQLITISRYSYNILGEVK